MMMKKKYLFLVLLIFGALIFSSHLSRSSLSQAKIPVARVSKRNIEVEIKTVGELEAIHSITIASSIKGDQGKIVDLIQDGVCVLPGQMLIKMDPTPFEEKIEKLRMQIKEQECCIATLEHTFEWDQTQAEHQYKASTFEVEAAQLELDKIKFGDGPQEISRLKSAVQKAWSKYDELNHYSNDLKALEDQGFLNTTELKQAQKKLLEEQELYETIKQQYESYIQHVFPMQVKKAETHLKRSQVIQEETAKSGIYSIAKSKALLEQAKQELADYFFQLHEAERELARTEIYAPTSGMVVLREEYRLSEKRKPRVGDILVKNQPLIDLPDLSSMMIKTRVREGDLYKIDVGKKVSIEVDAYPHLMFNGSITSIGILAQAEMGRSNEEKHFDVKICLDGSDPRLRPGMTSRATIHAQEAMDVLTIPIHTVFNDQKQTYCFVSYRGTYEKREISLGISNEQWVEVKSGLQEGEEICLINPFL